MAKKAKRRLRIEGNGVAVEAEEPSAADLRLISQVLEHSGLIETAGVTSSSDPPAEYVDDGGEPEPDDEPLQDATAALYAAIAEMPHEKKWTVIQDAAAARLGVGSRREFRRLLVAESGSGKDPREVWRGMADECDADEIADATGAPVEVVEQVLGQAVGKSA